MNVRKVALLAGLLISAPALWAGLMTGQLAVDVALKRTLVGLVVAAVAVTAAARLFASYAPDEGAEASEKEVHTGTVVPQYARRSTDEKAEEISSSSEPPSLPAPTGPSS